MKSMLHSVSLFISMVGLLTFASAGFADVAKTFNCIGTGNDYTAKVILRLGDGEDHATIILNVPSGPLQGEQIGGCQVPDPLHEPSRNPVYLKCKVYAPNNSSIMLQIYGGSYSLGPITGTSMIEGQFTGENINLTCK